MKTHGARRLTAEDLSVFRAVREPLSHWLREVHGSGGRIAGLQGLASAVVALVGIHFFTVSPLLAVLHALIALGVDGVGARLAVQRQVARDAPANPTFVSPGHALAFSEAVIAAQLRSGTPGRIGELPTGVLPHAKSLEALFPLAAPARTMSSAKWVFWVRWLFVVPVMTLAGLFVCLVVLDMALPLARAAVSLFDAYDWWGLAVFLALNLAHFGSTWRDLRSTIPNAPWAVGWLVEPPVLRQLIFWRMYKLLPLALAMVVGFVLAISPSTLLPHYKDPVAFAVALDVHLVGITTGLFALLAMLHVLLLFAPWHARRLIAALHSIEAAQPAAAKPKHAL